MARKTRVQPARDDQPFQLPAAELVFDPQEVLARVKADIERFIALDEELGERALHLAEDLNTLTRYHIAEPETVRKICQIILKMPLFLNLQNPPRTPVVHDENGGGDVDITITTTPPSSPSPTPSSSKIVQSQGDILTGTPIVYTAKIVQSLCDHLQKLGIDGAADLIKEYGPERVAEKLCYALDQPEGRIKDLPGYIVASVVGRSGKAAPVKTENRYLKGRYGHIVQH
jgi:hypothetical protein